MAAIWSTGACWGVGDRRGILILILARPVPVLAEASVLVIGTMRIGWWRFFAAVGLSNLGIAAIYAALGDRVQLPIAVVAAFAAPLVVAAVARRPWPQPIRQRQCEALPLPGAFQTVWGASMHKRPATLYVGGLAFYAMASAAFAAKR